MPGAAMDVYHLPHAGRTIYVNFVRAPNGVYFLSGVLGQRQMPVDGEPAQQEPIGGADGAVRR